MKSIDFARLPKVELHLHLDCSLSFDVVTRLAPAVTLEQYRERFVGPPKCTSLSDFLTRAIHGIQLMQTEQQLRLVTEDLFRQLKQDNVLYAEIRFAPLLHIEDGLLPEEVVGIIDESTVRGIQETGVEARIILCTLRHFNESQSLQTVKLVHKFRGTRVAGFDIAADEARYPIHEHVSAFQFAFEHGIPCTAHAGEARGPESVWETLRHFRPARLGHGVRSLEDMRLIAHLREKRIHLEVCPTCNIQTNIYDEYESHPIHSLFGLGVSLGVNTDARTISDIDLMQEYERLHRGFGWGREHFLTCNKNAVEAAFLGADQKKKLLDRLVGEYTKL